MDVSIDINTKFVEILVNLLLEQNKQLLQIIAEEEKLGYKKIMNFLPSQYQIKKQLLELSNQLDGFLEKSNSISESSVSSSASLLSDSEVE
jgi:hypothetical protein